MRLTIIEFGYNTVVALPSDKALRLLEILDDATYVEHKYENGNYKYIETEQKETLRATVVDSSCVISKSLHTATSSENQIKDEEVQHGA